MNEEMLKKLAALIGDETQAKEIADKAAADGFTDVVSCATVKEDEWVGYGMKKGVARQLVKELAAATAPAPTAAGANAAAAAIMAAQLPPVPSDESLLKDFQVGGVLKVEEVVIVAAMRALFANQFGIFDVDKRILQAIKAQAVALQEPTPAIYYEFQKLLKRKAHADVFQALDIPGDFFTQACKNEFLDSFRRVWSILSDFQKRLDGWHDELMSTVGNPMNLFAALAAGTAGIAGIGMNQMPDAAPIRDAAVGVVNEVNKMFAGDGIPTARALGADAIQLTQLLSKQELIAAIGATNREEMIRKLGLAVSPDMVRAETSSVRYVVGILRIATIGDDQLPSYIVALKNLGVSIPFDQLSGSKSNGTRDRSADSRYRGADVPPGNKTY